MVQKTQVGDQSPFPRLSLSASKPPLLKTQQIESNRYPKKIGERRRKLDRE
jgi:hypothetical protein